MESDILITLDNKLTVPFIPFFVSLAIELSYLPVIVSCMGGLYTSKPYTTTNLKLIRRRWAATIPHEKSAPSTKQYILLMRTTLQLSRLEKENADMPMIGIDVTQNVVLLQKDSIQH
jgi:hypothetical protein